MIDTWVIDKQGVRIFPGTHLTDGVHRYLCTSLGERSQAARFVWGIPLPKGREHVPVRRLDLNFMWCVTADEKPESEKTETWRDRAPML